MTSSDTESIAVTGSHRKAYESSLPEILGLPKDEIQAVNTDVFMAVGRVRAACGRIQGLRGEVAAKLNDFDLKLWDKLETYSFALLYANTVWDIARKSIADLDDLTQQARKQFELLYAVVQVLVSRGLVDQFHLKVAKKRRGRLRFAYGLLGLVEVLRKAWPTVADKTGLTESELTHAEALGEQLARGVALQNAPIEQLKQLAELRDRAFTVFVRAYGQVRHALQYLRREKNDAERYAPSLYGRRRSRKPKALAVAVAPNLDAHAATIEHGASARAAAVEQGASAQLAAIAPSANALLPVETVPERHQEASIDVDVPQVSASTPANASAAAPRGFASVSAPAKASAAAPRACARRKRRRAKRATTRIQSRAR